MDLGGFNMWLSGQHKRPADCGEGLTGVVTVSGIETAVQLDSERRGLAVYAPAGYYWTPEVGQQVLVIQGPGEIPCIVGVRQGSKWPENIGICADTLDVCGKGISVKVAESMNIHVKTMSVNGQDVSVQAEGDAIVEGKTVDLKGEVLINGEPLEVVIARIVAMLLGG